VLQCNFPKHPDKRAPAGRRKRHRRVDRLAPAERPAICREMGTGPLRRSRMERGAARVRRQGPGACAGAPPGGTFDAPPAPRTRHAPVRRVGVPRVAGANVLISVCNTSLSYGHIRMRSQIRRISHNLPLSSFLRARDVRPARGLRWFDARDRLSHVVVNGV